MAILRFAALTCLLLTGFVPIVMAPPLVYPFITGKAFCFRLLTDTAFVLWAILAALDHRYRPRYSRTLVVFIAVLAAALISDLRSDHPSNAFLSNVQRMDGYINLCHLFLFFLVASSLLEAERDRRRLIGGFVSASFIVALVAFYQLYLFTAQNEPTAQLWSTIGNPSYLGQYAALMMCLAAFMAAGAPRPWPWRAMSLLNLVIVGLAQSRGAALAAAAGITVCWFTTRSRHIKVAVLGMAALAVAGFAVPAIGGWEPLVARFEHMSLDDPRVPAWQAALLAAQDRPFFGWGQEGFREAHLRHCTAQCGLFDRAHNLVIDHLIEGGVFGALAWLWLLVAGREGIGKHFERDRRAALYGFLAVYVTSDMFLFDTLTSYLPLVSVLAISATEVSSREPNGPCRSRPGS